VASSTARFRVHGELADLLSAGEHGHLLVRPVDGTSTVKHVVESLGVPHTEYGELRVNGAPVHDRYQLRDGDVVDVYPAAPVSAAGTEPRFLLDAHLGTLARYLRLLGFDAAYDNDADDDELMGRAAAEARTLLTRDRGLLRRRTATNARFVRGTDPRDQLIDLVRRFGLVSRIRPYTRCTTCNGVLAPVNKADVARLVRPGTWRHHDAFTACMACGKVYWTGAHHARISRLVAAARGTEPALAGCVLDDQAGWLGRVAGSPP
jgi:uncharacterized protein